MFRKESKRKHVVVIGDPHILAPKAPILGVWGLLGENKIPVWPRSLMYIIQALKCGLVQQIPQILNCWAMASTQNSSENKNFWQRICASSTIHLSFVNPQITDAILKPSENPEPLPGSAKNIDAEKGKGEHGLLEYHCESGQENSVHKVSEVDVEKPGNEELQPSKQEDSNKIDLAVCIYGKLFENSNNGYTWKTKWYLPPIMVKLRQDAPGIEKLLQKLCFELYVIEPTKQENKFQVVLGSIRGASRKKIQNGNCEFKNIKIHSDIEGSKFQLLLLAYFVNEENPKLREYCQIYTSPEITVYNQSKFLLLEKADQLAVYFEMFDPQELDKAAPKTRTDKVETPQKLFQNYIFKKVPKIKNIFYLAIKFQDVVELYVNTSIYMVDGQLRKNFCQELSESISIPEQSEPSNMISNYIDPKGKVVLKINCSPNDMNYFINKSFTHEVCIVVGEDIVVPPMFTKISDIEELKKDYQDYCSKLQNQINNQNEQNPEGGASDQEESDSSDDQNSYNQNDDKKVRKKKSNKKKEEKRYVPNRAIKVGIPDAVRSAARNTRSRRKDGSDDEESLYDEQNMLMDEDEEDRPTKKTRASMAVDRRRKEFRLKEKIDEKQQHHDHMFQKSMNSNWENKPPQQQQPYPSMMMPMGMIDGTQMMSHPGMPYPIAGFPQMPTKNGAPQAMYLPQIIPVQVDNKKPQGSSSGSDKDKNKPPPQPQMMPGLPYGMMMTSDMMMKGLLNGQMPPNVGIINGMPPGAAISMMPPQMNPTNQQQQGGQKLQNKPSQDKSQESRNNEMKRMEMMYSQLPMFSMGGTPMMAVIPASGQGGSNPRGSQTGVPQMMAASLPSSLSQNGPFMVLSNQMSPPVVAPRPSNPSSSSGFQDKKKDSPPDTQQKKDEKRTPPVGYPGYHQQMPDSANIQSQQMSQHPTYAIINPNTLQQTLHNYEQLSGFANPGMNQGMQQMQQMGQFPPEMKMMMMNNPYAAFVSQSQGGGQGGNPAIQQFMGFPAGSMNPAGFSAQSPYTVIGMHPKPAGSEQDSSKNKESQQKQDDKSKQSTGDKKTAPQQVGFPMMQSGGFYMPTMGAQTNPQMQMAMQSMPMMTAGGSFAFPMSMMPRADQQVSGNSNWQGDQGFLQMQGLASMQGMAGMQGMPTGLQMMNFGQMGMPPQYMGGQGGPGQMMQGRNPQPQGQSFSSVGQKKKEEKKK